MEARRSVQLFLSITFPQKAAHEGSEWKYLQSRVYNSGKSE